MSALSKALDEIKFRIPAVILQIAFEDNAYNWRSTPVSIDEKILTKVIRSRVIVDCNLQGNAAVVINLDGLNPRYADLYSIVYEIPPQRLQYRDIISVLSVSYLPQSLAYNGLGYGAGMVMNQGSNEISSVGQRIADSVSNIPVVSQAEVDLIGPNTVLVRDAQRVTSAYQLRCILSNDKDMNNLNPRAWPEFSKACELAVKSYIYNTLLVRLDQGFLQAGQELGSVKNYVEGLSDAEENYQTHMKEVMGKVLFINDSKAHERFIKIQLNPAV